MALNSKNDMDILDEIDLRIGGGNDAALIVEKERSGNDQGKDQRIANAAIAIARKITGDPKAPGAVKSLSSLMLLSLAAGVQSPSLKSKLVGAARNTSKK